MRCAVCDQLVDKEAKEFCPCGSIVYYEELGEQSIIQDEILLSSPIPTVDPTTGDEAIVDEVKMIPLLELVHAYKYVSQDESCYYAKSFRFLDETAVYNPHWAEYESLEDKSMHLDQSVFDEFEAKNILDYSISTCPQPHYIIMLKGDMSYRGIALVTGKETATSIGQALMGDSIDWLEAVLSSPETASNGKSYCLAESETKNGRTLPHCVWPMEEVHSACPICGSTNIHNGKSELELHYSRLIGEE